MKPRRIVLVTRRFWPLVGRSVSVSVSLSAGLAQRGHQVTLVTAKWEEHWPAQLDHRGVRVVRLADPSQGRFGPWRCRRELRNWLKRHHAELDVALVNGLREDAYTVVAAGQRHNLPVIVIADGLAAREDLRWQREERAGRAIARRCRKAASIVASSPIIQQHLLLAGYDHQQLSFAPPGVPITAARSAARKTEARAALESGNRLFGLLDDTPLVVYAGSLLARKSIITLINAWPQVLRSSPDARLWIAGDGPEVAVLQRAIDRHKLNHRVWLVGAFDSVDELLAAADLFVLPSLEEELSLSLIEAMAAGLPVVASDIAGNRSLIEAGETGVLVKPRDEPAWASAVATLLRDERRAAALGKAARAYVAERFGVDRMITRYEQLAERLVTSFPRTGEGSQRGPEDA